MIGFSILFIGLLGIGLPILLVIGWWILAHLAGRAIRRSVEQRDAAGREVPRTAMARLSVANLPADVAFVASLGRGGIPQDSLGRLILRPTWGLRLISLGLTAVMGIIVVQSNGALLPASLWVNVGLAAVLLYGVLFIAVYELSYDTHEIVAPGRTLQRVTVTWADVASLRDDGHYFYILRTHDGRKLEIPKYLVGIADFLAYAKAQMEYHDARLNARTARG